MKNNIHDANYPSFRTQNFLPEKQSSNGWLTTYAALILGVTIGIACALFEITPLLFFFSSLSFTFFALIIPSAILSAMGLSMAVRAFHASRGVQRWFNVLVAIGHGVMFIPSFLLVIIMFLSFFG